MNEDPDVVPRAETATRVNPGARARRLAVVARPAVIVMVGGVAIVMVMVVRAVTVMVGAVAAVTVMAVTATVMAGMPASAAVAHVGSGAMVEARRPRPARGAGVVWPAGERRG